MERDVETEPLVGRQNVEVNGVGTHKKNARRIITRPITIEVVVVCLSLYFAASIPLTQQFVYNKIANQYNFNQSANSSVECSSNETGEVYRLQKKVQEESARWMMYNSAVALLPCFISCLFLGGYSDVAGRKLPLFVTHVGFFLKLVMVALIIHFDLPLPYLLLASVVEGMCGGVAVAYMSAFAYVSDITHHGNRTIRIIILETLVNTGSILSNVGMGYLIKNLGFLWPYIILSGLIAFSVLYIIFLPEPVIKDPSARILSVENVKKTITLYIKDNAMHRRWKLHIMVVITFVICIPELASSDVITYTALDFPLCFSSVEIGYFYAAVVLFSSVFSIMATLLLERRLKETGLMLLGCLSGCGYMLTIAFAISTFSMFIAAVPGLLYRVIMGTIRAYNSKLMEPSELGSLFAGIAWIQIVASVVGGVGNDAIYSATVSSNHSIVFYYLTGMYAIGAVLIVVTIVKENTDRKRSHALIVDEVFVG